ncbi:hypothetical protein K1719_006035 [Acacia pycnantha]|nr:hypothetical protein K1719_006035 [Acacia pycnantha]
MSHIADKGFVACCLQHLMLSSCFSPSPSLCSATKETKTIVLPWYAHAIAEAIMRTANFSVPLKIYEIGGGSGTCAKGILDYIMLNAPAKVYNNMTYTSVEISPSISPSLAESRCHDAADRTGWGDVEQQPCWVMMLEVLDNLPHDLIYSENQVSSWKEVWVERQHDSARSMVKNIWSKLYPIPRRCWLPTGCLKFFEVLHEALPKMSLVASDFSYLPDVTVPGERAPLVSTKRDGRSTDYTNYLEAQGDADIFFPTDFWLLERIDHYCSGWLKPQGDNTSKKGKKRRTITV